MNLVVLVVLVVLIVFKFDFHLVKAFAVHAGYVGLRDEGLGVNRLDDAENVGFLNAAAQHHEHLHVLLAVPAHAREHGAAAIHLGGDGVGDFLPVFRENEELHRLPVVVNDHIDHNREDNKEHKAINDGFDRMEDKP